MTNPNGLPSQAEQAQAWDDVRLNSIKGGSQSDPGGVANPGGSIDNPQETTRDEAQNLNGQAQTSGVDASAFERAPDDGGAVAKKRGSRVFNAIKKLMANNGDRQPKGKHFASSEQTEHYTPQHLNGWVGQINREISDVQKDRKKATDSLENRRNALTAEESLREEQKALREEIDKVKQGVPQMIAYSFRRLAALLEGAKKGNMEKLQSLDEEWEAREEKRSGFQSRLDESTFQSSIMREGHGSALDRLSDRLTIFGSDIQLKTLEGMFAAAEQVDSFRHGLENRKTEREAIKANRVALKQSIENSGFRSLYQYRNQLNKDISKIREIISIVDTGDGQNPAKEALDKEIAKRKQKLEQIDGLFPTVGNRIKNLFRRAEGRGEYQGKHFNKPETAVEGGVQSEAPASNSQDEVMSWPSREELLNVPEIESTGEKATEEQSPDSPERVAA